MYTLTFEVPPFPTYINGSEDRFEIGKKHIKRTFSVFDLLIVKKGVIYICENDINYDVKEGEYVILTPGFEHYGYKGCDFVTEYFYIHFQLEVPFNLKKNVEINWSAILKQEKTFTEPARHILHLPNYGKFNNFEYVMNELTRLFSLRGTNTPLNRLNEQILFQQIVLQIQSDAINIPTRAEEVTKQVISFIESHYKNDSIKMEHLSKQLLFNQDYITRCMQKTIGKTPMQYLTSYRLAVAKQLLTKTNAKLDVISKDIGIQDSTYFSRIFKKIEGMTPIEYRRLTNREGS